MSRSIHKHMFTGNPTCSVCGMTTAEYVESIEDEYKKLAKVSHTLAVLSLQSDRYHNDGEFKRAVDDVLAGYY